MKDKLRSSIYIGLGFFFLLLGLLGLALPVLPTTPFLLLASYFFSRGSDKFYSWFISTKIYEKHLEDFVTRRAMTLGTKIKLLSFATSVLLLSAFLVKLSWVRIMIGGLLVFMHYYFAVHIKTIGTKIKKKMAYGPENLS